MSAMQPGWHPDPHGRFTLRYHDGRAWTEHVTDPQGAQQTDPSGAGAGGAWAQPAPAAPAAPVAPAAPTWQVPAGSATPLAPSPPASAVPPPFAPPGTGAAPPTAASTQAIPVQTATLVLTGPAAGGPAEAAPAGRRGGAAWLGVALALAGAALVVVGLLFGLDWLALGDQTSDRSEVSDLLDAIDEQGGSPSILSTTFFSWGWIVALVVAGVVVLVTLTLRLSARIAAADVALVALAWVLFGWLNLRAYLNNDFNNERLGFDGDPFDPGIGGWLTVAGLAALALGALLGGPLARRRR